MTGTAVLDWSAPAAALAPGLAFATEPRVVAEDDVRAFAALTGDDHPQHVDPAWAARSPFGSTIAHGLLVLSCAAGLVPFDPQRVVALRAVRDAVFKRPVRPGDAVRVEGEVEAVRDLPDGSALVTCRWRVLGPDDRVACAARVEVVWR